MNTQNHDKIENNTESNTSNNAQSIANKSSLTNNNTAKGEKEITGDTVQFLTFRLGDELYGLDIMKIREIKGWQQSTRLPNSPEYMRGVINLRGLVIPIFDLRTKFGMGNTQATDKHVTIIVAVGERTIGILVDAVSDILTVSVDEIRLAPDVETNGISEHFILGLLSVEDKMVVLLNIENLFDLESINF